MHRFYIDLTKTGNLITNSESYHAIRVLRVKVGEKIVCFDGNGNEILVWKSKLISTMPYIVKDNPPEIYDRNKTEKIIFY